jgi:asparagine synthase (glutamine-hydrolysing)
MCGLVAVVNLDGRPAARDVLARMAGAIAHRGPDDEGEYLEGPVGFFHKRLAIIDLATGHQPMTSDGVTIAYNGEIYNYVELREELQSRGHRFETASDTEVILKAYLEHGPDCVAALNGMFAFVLHDRRQGKVVTARDHFGVKPLYWHAAPGHVLFASEIKALLRHPDVAAEVNEPALRDYLTFQFVLGEGTLFKGIHKLPPGHLQVLDLAGGQLQTRRFWEPSFRLDPYHTPEYFIEETRRLLDEAVRLQVRSDVPVGAYLSGGHDSSVVATLASRRVAPRLQTFTAVFRDGPEFDETPYAREVAAACGAERHEVVPTEAEFVELMPRLVYHMDEPAAGPGLFPQYVLARLARQHVKVVLGGQGGDEIFGGYARYLVAYLEQALKGAIFENNEEQEHIVSLQSIVPNLPALRAYAPMLRQFWREGMFEPMDRRYFRLVDRSGGALGLLSADFRAAQDPEAIFGRFQQSFNHPDTLSYYNKMTHFDLVNNLPALLHVEDRVSMAVSLESRVPLLDYRLADLITSMPPRMKFKGGEMKYLFKKAVKDLIPERVFARKDKMGLPVPLHLWMRGRAGEFFRDVLLSPRTRQRGLFDSAAVESQLASEAAFGRSVWGLLNLELWFRQFIDARPAAEA